MKQVQLVYGSNGGNTQLVCEYVMTTLQQHGYSVKLNRCEHFPVENLTTSDLLILAAPTYEHGELEPHFLAHFWPRIQAVDLKQQACAVIGLGDIKYDIDHHIKSAFILQDYVQSHNGCMLCPPLMVSGQPLPLLEKLVKPWTERLEAKLASL